MWRHLQASVSSCVHGGGGRASFVWTARRGTTSAVPCGCQWIGGGTPRALHTATNPSAGPPLVTVALLGPPNAGKSTLFNRLSADSAVAASIKHIRSKNHKVSGRLVRTANVRGRPFQHVRGTAIVSSVPGTTRDVNVCRGRVAGIDFDLIDTAGIDVSSSSKIHHEAWMRDALRQTKIAAHNADVVFLVVDGQLPRLTSDVHETASQLRRLPSSSRNNNNNDSDPSKERMVRVLVNKMESMSVGEYPDVLEEAEALGFGEPIPISALHGEGMAEIASIIQQATEAKERRSAGGADGAMDAPAETAQGESSPEESVLTSDPNAPLVLAILGRVNVGKSTLVNQLVELGSLQNQQSGSDDDDSDDNDVAAAVGEPLGGTRRVMTGPTPGLTRDSIRLSFEWQPHKTIEVIDTAGIRKALTKREGEPTSSSSASSSSSSSSSVSGATSAMQHPDIESVAVQEAFHACKTAHVVALVIDAGARTLLRSELAMCDAILKEGRALVVVANKMDLVVEPGYTPEQFADDVRDQLEARFPLLRKTPVVPLSAISGNNVSELLPVVWKARERWQQKIPTPRLNRWIREVQALHVSPSVSSSSATSNRRNKAANNKNTKKDTATSTTAGAAAAKVRAKIKYMLQTRLRPPTFLLYCNSNSLPDSHLRFLTRHFQDTFEFFGMPVRLSVRRS